MVYLKLVVPFNLAVQNKLLAGFEYFLQEILIEPNAVNDAGFIPERYLKKARSFFCYPRAHGEDLAFHGLIFACFEIFDKGEIASILVAAR